MTAAVPAVSLAIVSHRQLPLVERALASLARTPPRLTFEIVILENEDAVDTTVTSIAGLPVHLQANPAPVGLARNLNRVIQDSRGDLVCVVNPDVVFLEDVITPLADVVRQGQADIAAPTIVDSRGGVLESARAVPRPLELVARRLAPDRAAGRDRTAADLPPAWLAGTFLIMRRATFQALAGFDERYHLYFEDVDFGCRACLAGFRLLRSPSLGLQHEAAHRSRSHPRYFAWHVASALRFFTSPTYRAARRWEKRAPG